MSQFKNISANAINQAPEASAFLSRIAALPKSPGAILDPVLAPSVQDETEIRQLFAQDRQHPRLSNPYVGVVSVFEASTASGIHATRARVIKDEDDAAAKYVFPLPQEKRRKEGEPCMVESLEDFQKNWAVFTEGSLVQLTDWSNVVAAGGSVLGCLLPLPKADRETKRTMRKFYHSSAYPTSDVDLFIWGLNAEQAEAKIKQIYEAVRDSIPWDVTCVRTKHAVSIHSQYPYRSIQIVLRLYHSPAEILAGFDVDAACVAYDGQRVLANPRSLIALMRQANTVDMSRRSPSYEVRLAKYAARGFEVYIPNLSRSDLDPTIFERSLNRITGLARLLVLEKLSTPQARVSYLESRRNLRSRPQINNYNTRKLQKKRKGDLKAEEEIAGIDMNDYDLTSLQIPYGPNWTAKRIEKIVYGTDLGINSTFNPKNKGRRLHRHPAFFGTMEECIEDLCGFCPEPENDDERALQEEEDKSFIRGRISFIKEDPGRQTMTGSFNPIDIGEWCEQAYLKPIDKLFAAIAENNVKVVQHIVEAGEVHVNHRDHVGRTPLHVAIMCGSSDCALALIDSGALMVARLVDGRTALHLAAQMNLPSVVEKLLERSTINAERIKEAEKAAADEAAKKKQKHAEDESNEDEDDDERPSSEDDWSSEEDDNKKETKNSAKAEDSAQLAEDTDVLEDNTDLPNVLDINATDWDLAFTPLAYAIVGGFERIVQTLLNAGADPKMPTRAKANIFDTHVLHPLTLTIFNDNEDRAIAIVDQLLRAGASSSQANEELYSIFHSVVRSGKTRIIVKLLEADPKSAAALNIPTFCRGKAVYPLVSAIAKGYLAIAVYLIAYGANVAISADDLQKAKNMRSANTREYHYARNNNIIPHAVDYLRDVYLPLEIALADRTYLFKLLIELGAQVSFPINNAFHESQYNPKSRLSLLDWVEKQIGELKKKDDKTQSTSRTSFTDNPKTFADYRRFLQGKLEDKREADRSPNDNADEKHNLQRVLAFFEEAKVLLEKQSAMSYDEIYEDSPDEEKAAPNATLSRNRLKDASITELVKSTIPPPRTQYQTIHTNRWKAEPVLPHLLDQYDALFDACWKGDNATIEELCLPRRGSKSDKAPIQIAVRSREFSDPSNSFSYTDTTDGVHTPLSVALHARKWDTARLIMAIAKAQQKQEEPKPEKNFSATIMEIDLDDKADSDCDSDADSDESMDTDDDDAKEIGSFTDLATRTSAVQCDASPQMLLDVTVTSRLSQDGKSVIPAEKIIDQACAEGDLEMFVTISDLYKLLPDDAQNLDGDSLLLRALTSDSPELVDEIIRRTGAGIDIGGMASSQESQLTEAVEPSKLYLGLTVHGKKRKDLATKGFDKNQRNVKSKIPIFWSAVVHNAKKTIEYLSGPGPLAAYRYFANSNSTAYAEQLRAFQGFDKQLPALLGILPNKRNETPVTALLLRKFKEDRSIMTKYLLSLHPRQAKAYLQAPIWFSDLTPLLLATIENVESTYLDYLLANGASADIADKRGWNIYHIVCMKGFVELLDYFLRKLPHELSTRLLISRSYRVGNTPLMIAVKRGQLTMVEKLLRSGIDSVKESLMKRDNNGSMPLHAAVRNGYADITSLLITHGGVEVLYSENAVGETPVETAYMQWLLHATRQGFPGASPSYELRPLHTSGTLDVTGPAGPERLTLELELMEKAREKLTSNGKLTMNAKLKQALDSFIEYVSKKLDKPLTEIRSTPKKLAYEAESENREKTYKVVSSSVFASPSPRRLVHIIDVQHSVRNSLNDAVPKTTKRNITEGEGGIEDEDNAQLVAERECWNGVLSWDWTLRLANDP